MNDLIINGGTILGFSGSDVSTHFTSIQPSVNIEVPNIKESIVVKNGDSIVFEFDIDNLNVKDLNKLFISIPNFTEEEFTFYVDGNEVSKEIPSLKNSGFFGKNNW